MVPHPKILYKGKTLKTLCFSPLYVVALSTVFIIPIGRKNCVLWGRNLDIFHKQAFIKVSIALEKQCYRSTVPSTPARQGLP